MSRHTDDEDDKILRDRELRRIPMMLRDDDGVTGAGSRGPRGQQVGDKCTRNGFNGVLRRGPDGLFCDIGRKDALTDGRSTDPLAMNRPGYRMFATDAGRKACYDARATYQRRIANEYKLHDNQTLCNDCDGSGLDTDGDVCPTCGGTGTLTDAAVKVINSQRVQPTSDHAVADNRAKLQQLYADHDRELSEAWRGGK